MKKSLVLAALVAAVALSACGKKKKPLRRRHRLLKRPQLRLLAPPKAPLRPPAPP